MPFAHIGRGMLQNARDEADFLGRIRGDEGRRCTAEVMQAHGLAEFGEDTRANDVSRCDLRLADIPYTRPKARHEGADRGGEAGSLSDSEGDRGGDRSGHPEALGAAWT